ncbi:MAG: PAS domain-containing sensor histidine kinase [Minicystis sp.]
MATDDLYRLLVERVKDYAIFILDPLGQITTWNEGAQRIKGYAAVEVVGKHFSLFYPVEDVASGKCARTLQAAIEEGRFEEEGWRIRKDGKRFWASVTITPLRSEAGTLLGFAKITRDLSELKAAEEEAQRFRLLVESVMDYGIFILDPTGHVATWNVGAERLKGYAAKEILGKHFSVFYPPEDVAAGKCELELKEAARLGRFEDEGWRVRKDGSRFWANVVITALHSHGELVGFAKVTRDLTERREIEQRRLHVAAKEAAMAELARVQEFHERFISLLGHDLRNPLAAIDMGADLLRMQAKSEPSIMKVVNRIRGSSRRLSRMIEQVLDLTRSRLGGGIVMAPQPMELCDMLAAIIDEMRLAHPLRNIVYTRSAPIEGTWDLDRLGRVFANLVGNALQHGSKDTAVTIETHHDGEAVHIDVHNHGTPIPEPIRVGLFNPFRRGERDSRTKETEGLGLGLYISREIALAHGGDIHVRSTASEGTTFRVTLPMDKGSSR